MEDEYINPKAKKLCETCFDKADCKKDIFEQIFCKLEQIERNIYKLVIK
jgi:hypothetical protein